MSNIINILSKLEPYDATFVYEITNEISRLQVIRQQFALTVQEIPEQEASIQEYLESSTISDLVINNRIMKKTLELIPSNSDLISLIQDINRENKFILQLNSLVKYSDEFKEKSLLRTQAVFIAEIFSVGLIENKLPLEEIEGLFGLKIIELQQHVFNIWKIILDYLGKEKFTELIGLSLESGCIDEMFIELLIEFGNFKVDHDSVRFLTESISKSTSGSVSKLESDSDSVTFCANNIFWEYDYMPKV